MSNCNIQGLWAGLLRIFFLVPSQEGQASTSPVVRQWRKPLARQVRECAFRTGRWQRVSQGPAGKYSMSTRWMVIAVSIVAMFSGSVYSMENRVNVDFFSARQVLREVSKLTAASWGDEIPMHALLLFAPGGKLVLVDNARDDSITRQVDLEQALIKGQDSGVGNLAWAEFLGILRESDVLVENSGDDRLAHLVEIDLPFSECESCDAQRKEVRDFVSAHASIDYVLMTFAADQYHFERK